MSIIPSSLARVPNLLASQVALSNLTRTSGALLQTQLQLSTGKQINRPSDNAIGASAVSALDDIIERRDQYLRNLSHADSMLGTLDSALADATELIMEAKGIGSSQIGLGSDATTRANQATVIDALVNELFNVSSRRFQQVHLFSGAATAVNPFEAKLAGYVYKGIGAGHVTDLGMSLDLPITVSGSEAFGALSSRVQGDRDLDPGMNANTRLVDLSGTQGLGVRLGTVNVDVNGNDYDLDLTGANRVQDVITEITDLLNLNEPGALGPGGVTVDGATGNRFNIDVNPGFTITFSDLGTNATAADLGLSAAAFQDGVNEIGDDVDPRLTEQTMIAELTGVTAPLGTIRITNGGRTRDLDLSGVTNIQELMNAVEAIDLGVRVEIADTGDRLNFVNELSGGEMSIAEVAGGSTATELGVRSFTGTTLLEDFNDGRGIQILSGNVDPQTGLPDPALDLDFRVTVKDGRTFDVDLAGTTTVQDVLDGINAAAAGAGLTVPAEFSAGLAADGNGFELTDNTAGTTTSVTALNGSFAASDLGILASTASATLTGEDRATVAVDSTFSHLIDLRNALLSNDHLGITFATEKLEGDIGRLTRTRADVGVRSQRVTRQERREEDLRIQDVTLRSSIEDLDFSEAAVRFSNLQQQLQAGLATTARATSLSLLDFLR